jgi:hypothetical protein
MGYNNGMFMGYTVTGYIFTQSRAYCWDIVGYLDGKVYLKFTTSMAYNSIIRGYQWNIHENH